MDLGLHKIELGTEFFLSKYLLSMLIGIPILEELDRDSKKGYRINAYEHLDDLWQIEERIAQRFGVVDRIVNVEGYVPLKNPRNKRRDQ